MPLLAGDSSGSTLTNKLPVRQGLPRRWRGSRLVALGVPSGAGGGRARRPRALTPWSGWGSELGSCLGAGRACSPGTVLTHRTGAGTCPSFQGLWPLNVTSHTRWPQQWLEHHLCGQRPGARGGPWGSGRAPQRWGQIGFVLDGTAVGALGQTQASDTYQLWVRGWLSLLGMAKWQDLWGLWGLGPWAWALCDLGTEVGRPTRQ